jgi:hypothetical protein
VLPNDSLPGIGAEDAIAQADEYANFRNFWESVSNGDPEVMADPDVRSLQALRNQAVADGTYDIVEYKKAPVLSWVRQLDLTGEEFRKSVRDYLEATKDFDIPRTLELSQHMLYRAAEYTMLTTIVQKTKRNLPAEPPAELQAAGLAIIELIRNYAAGLGEGENAAGEEGENAAGEEGAIGADMQSGPIFPNISRRRMTELLFATVTTFVSGTPHANLVPMISEVSAVTKFIQQGQLRPHFDNFDPSKFNQLPSYHEFVVNQNEFLEAQDKKETSANPSSYESIMRKVAKERLLSRAPTVDYDDYRPGLHGLLSDEVLQDIEHHTPHPVTSLLNDAVGALRFAGNYHAPGVTLGVELAASIAANYWETGETWNSVIGAASEHQQAIIRNVLRNVPGAAGGFARFFQAATEAGGVDPGHFQTLVDQVAHVGQAIPLNDIALRNRNVVRGAYEAASRGYYPVG